jgi:sulfhydrogenase subunit beta (sulfur reductase)
MHKDAVVLLKNKLREWVNILLEKYVVSAPVKGYRDYNFRVIDEETEFTLDYTRTVIPPKKHLHPTRERMASYKIGEGADWNVPPPDKKTVVLGVHPCDARAIVAYDRVFDNDMPDPYYRNHRKNTIFVGMTCLHPDEHCFCLTFNDEGPTLLSSVCDLNMTDIGDRYFIEIGSPEGSMMVQYPFFERATDEDRKERFRTAEFSKQKIRKLNPDGEHLPEFLKSHYDHDVWKPEVEKCMTCGNCTMVCPTCFCYHQEDLNKWNVKDGERVRMWDSCQLIDFSEVAMGENFRKDKAARMKWRIYHKLAYWPEQFNTFGCTGCGRCITFCIADIDMTRIIAAIKGEETHA